MIGYIVRRLLLAIVTIWAISVVAFVIIQLPPGDFVDSLHRQALVLGLGGQRPGGRGACASSTVSTSRSGSSTGKWISASSHGDFGVSLEWSRPVTEVIGDRLWLTIVISFAAIILTWGIALPIGIYSAVRQYSIADYVFTLIGFIGLAVPNFLLALIIMYLRLHASSMPTSAACSRRTMSWRPGPGPRSGT